MKTFLQYTSAGAVVLATLSAAAASAAPLQESWQEQARLAAYEVQDLILPAQASAALVLPILVDDEPLTLELLPHSLRAPDFEVIVHTETGVFSVPAPPESTFRGRVVEAPGSVVSASLREGGLSARIVMPERDELWMQPLSDLLPNSPRGLHVIYRTRDVLSGDERCGVSAPSVPTVPEAPPAQKGSTCFTIAEIAFDVDFEYFVANGSSVNNTVNDVLGLLNDVNAIYTNDVGIAHSVTTMVIRAGEPDPYNSTDPGCCNPGYPCGILSEFRDEWNTTYAHIDRDTAHLITGKELDGSTIGCATISAICRTPPSDPLNLAIGVSQARYSPTMSLRVGLVAHELGHNWGANHGTSSGCVNENLNIMCCAINSCNQNVTSFVQTSIDAIVAHRDSRTCLGDEIFVDLAASAPFYGTFHDPWDTVMQGALCGDNEAKISIESGTYAESPVTISSNVSLRAKGGTVRIE